MSRSGTTSNVHPPRGFRFRTAAAGIKRPGRRDLAVIVSDVPAVAAGVFTTNAVEAAPVRLGKRMIASGAAQAIVANSGNANACTGHRGMKDAREMTRTVARAFGLSADAVLVCSTGVIGEPLPMDRIVPGIQRLAEAPDEPPLAVARAIMTTDTYPKALSRRLRIGGKVVTMTGIAKGAGMIAPNMATMLGFMLTGTGVSPAALDRVVRYATDRSFNRLTVDGDRSTNDTVLALANGQAGNRVLTTRSPEYGKFQDHAAALFWDLARMIADDGEGARHLIEVHVTGAASRADAHRVAMAVADSNLVKTAVYGRDANWGRILCAAGYSGARLRESRTRIDINGIRVMDGGLTTRRDAAAARAMKKREVLITIHLGVGRAEGKALTCDLTEDYIKINAEYRS